MRLEGKVAVITGAGSGMGRAMANLFASEGAKVVGADWHQESLDEVVSEVRAAGGEMTGIQGNVAVKDDCERLIDAAVSTFGGIDVLCNNAGVMDLMQGVAELDDAMWERVMGININGPMFLTRKAVPLMIARGGGAIVNTASAAGIGGGAAGAAYTVSKHALVGLTRSTAFTYALKGIRCNAMACGGVETNIMQSVDATKMDAEGAARYGLYQALIPAFLKPLDIANLALFLASDDAKHINGAIIPIDGGWTSA
jgi:NAD(P)-dependent dehydrogenase (short-subunit alcohol dehydrogenase family)